MTSLGLLSANWTLALSDLARNSESLLQHSLSNPGPTTLAVVFVGGLLTSLGPCSLSLLPVTLAYLAGFGSDRQHRPDHNPWLRSLSFAGGIVVSLVLLGLLRLPLPAGPDPERWRRQVPAPFAPLAAGLAFGLAATPCTTPVLAVLLGWMAQAGRPLVGMLLLTSFGAGQVVPLLLAGTAAASLPGLLSLRRLGQWVPPISGVVLVTTGVLTLVARWS
jgi:cytochrome c-type biogenesis protein